MERMINYMIPRRVFGTIFEEEVEFVAGIDNHQNCRSYVIPAG